MKVAIHPKTAASSRTAATNPVSKSIHKNRSLVSGITQPLALKMLEPETVDGTQFDFDTFLSVGRRTDIPAKRSIGRSGLETVIETLFTQRPLPIAEGQNCRPAA
jgi:hypothetical protein